MVWDVVASTDAMLAVDVYVRILLGVVEYSSE